MMDTTVAVRSYRCKIWSSLTVDSMPRWTDLQWAIKRLGLASEPSDKE